MDSLDGCSEPYFVGLCKGIKMDKIKERFKKAWQFAEGHRKQCIAVAASLTIVAILICVISIKGCTAAEETNPVVVETSAHESGNKVDSNKTEASKASNEAQANAKDPATEGNTTEQTASSNDGATQALGGTDLTTEGVSVTTNAPQSPSTTAPSNPGTAETPSATAPTPETSEPAKRWVVDYTQVWVEDTAAWDEQIPMYNYTEISVCNICGADVTGNEAPHAKVHALAGEGGGHHTEVIQTISGYNTIHHEGTGHYESVESGGHWE